MEDAVNKFAHDIIMIVFTKHLSRPAPAALTLTKNLARAPILYNHRCNHVLSYYLTFYRGSIAKYYLQGYSNIDANIFNDVVNKLVLNSSCHYQCAEVFYRLCVQLALLGVIAFEKGYADGLSRALEEIVTLANKAYLRCDLDEKYDSISNFSFDVLNLVFNWDNRETNLSNHIKRLSLDFNSQNFFSLYKSHFQFFLQNNGKAILKKFRAYQSSLRTVTREAFIFQTKEWCDDYYRQLGQLGVVKLRTNFLDICMRISLLALHAYEILYPCDLHLPHEIILRLGILTSRYGIFVFGPIEIEKSEVVNVE